MPRAAGSSPVSALIDRRNAALYATRSPGLHSKTFHRSKLRCSVKKPQQPLAAASRSARSGAGKARRGAAAPTPAVVAQSQFPRAVRLPLTGLGSAQRARGGRGLSCTVLPLYRRLGCHAAPLQNLVDCAIDIAHCASACGSVLLLPYSCQPLAFESLPQFLPIARAPSANRSRAICRICFRAAA